MGFRQTSLNKHAQEAERAPGMPSAAVSPDLPGLSLAKARTTTEALGVGRWSQDWQRTLRNLKNAHRLQIHLHWV